MARRIVHHTAPAKPPNPRASQKQKGPAPPPPPEWRRWLLYLGIAATILLFFLPIGGTSSTELSYTQFVNDVTAGKVKTATIDSNGGVSGTLTDGTAYTTQIPVALQDTNLSGLLQQHNVQITGESPAAGRRRRLPGPGRTHRLQGEAVGRRAAQSEFQRRRRLRGRQAGGQRGRRFPQAP